MGGGSSKLVKYKVLLLGLDGAGKTTLLYKLRLKNAQAEFFGKWPNKTTAFTRVAIDTATTIEGLLAGCALWNTLFLTPALFPRINIPPFSI